MASSDVADAYNLLGLSSEAREDEINKAFRQKSLKVHPDRNPNNPEAAAKFHELKQAQELLLDPQRRAELDASLKRQRDYAERYANANAKRKQMMDALEEKERETKRAKTMTAVEKRKEEERLQELKEASRRMREEREGPLEDAGQQEAQEEEIQVPEDIPVTIKYKPSKRPDLLTESALVSLFRQFGPIDSSLVKLKLKPPKDKPNAPPKFATAVLLFKKVEDAFGAIGASGRQERNLKDVQVDWVGGEPDYVKKLREKGALDSGKSNSASEKASGSTKASPFNLSFFSRPLGQTTVSGGNFDSFPDLDGSDTRSNQSQASKAAAAASESVMLMRLRQAERDRLAREIIEAEEKGEA